MIKVIRKGTLRQIKCEDCESVLRYEWSDVQFEALESDVIDETPYIAYIVCPVCKNEVEIKTKKIPDYVDHTEEDAWKDGV